MRCLRCNGYMAPETIFAEGYWIDQRRCVCCGEIQFIREPMEAPAPERRTGRGRDNRRRQSYGMSKLIRPEDWVLPNSALADRYGLATTTISHNRPNKRASRHSGKLGYPEIPSEAPRIEAEGH
jgi:hypothetical protein